MLVQFIVSNMETFQILQVLSIPVVLVSSLLVGAASVKYLLN